MRLPVRSSKLVVLPCGEIQGRTMRKRRWSLRFESRPTADSRERLARSVRLLVNSAVGVQARAVGPPHPEGLDERRDGNIDQCRQEVSR
jgi:hypothetical protein